MASLDILVSPSHGESFPLIVGEAMSCGVPCLVTDVGDCSWMVGDTGIVVKPGSNQDLAKGLKKRNLEFVWLCDNPKKIGKKIYGKRLVHFEALQGLNNPQSIITVANEQAQKEIRRYFSDLQQSPMLDYFFFC